MWFIDLGESVNFSRFEGYWKCQLLKILTVADGKNYFDTLHDFYTT